jgi:hypothetical protein
MSSKASLRNIGRAELHQTKFSIISEMKLLKNHPEKYLTIQIRKLLLIGDSERLMSKEKFKTILMDYIMENKIPEMPNELQERKNE